MAIAFLYAATALFPFLFASDQPPKPSLAVVQAGVQQADDAPFVTTDYHFLPGDYVYFTFGVSGFGIQTDATTQTRRLALSYEITPEDTSGRPLAKSESGTIAEELAPEDKDWTPKRRASFILPSGLAAGEFQIHLVVKDAIAKTEIAKDVPFSVGGVTLTPANSVTVEHFQFFRTERDREPLEVPAYSPGDTVYTRFDLAGFKVDSQNAYHLTYGIKVLRPDGNVYLEQPNAAEVQEDSFYPAQFVPANLEIETKPNATRGQYTILLTVHDLIAGQSYETRQAFTLE